MEIQAVAHEFRFGDVTDGQLDEARKEHNADDRPGSVELEQGDKIQEGHGWNLTVRDFLDVIDGKKPNLMNSKFGARNVAICDAAMKSIKSGKVEPVTWFN